ncbi:MAG: reverse transcriptase-like protein, partial [Actinomycetota bacterium]|nr:reverse transcriptase-like protein [Actinomycetota bacterium]
MGSHDSVIIEADGGSRGNPGPAGFGALLRDATTDEVVAKAAEAIGRATNNVAEYRGLIAGLELYLAHTPDALLEVRMDSKLVIEQMAGRWKVKHPSMRPLAIQAQRLAPFGTVWTWVPRERNKATDRLANLAMDASARGEVYDVRAGGDTTEAEHNGPGDPTPAAMEPPAFGVGDPTRAAMEPPASGVGGLPTSGDGVTTQGSRNPMLGWSGRLGDATTLIFLRHGVTPHTGDR